PTVEEPELTPEVEQDPEATPEATPDGPQPLLYTDFETEPVDWTLDPAAQIITAGTDSADADDPEATPDVSESAVSQTHQVGQFPPNASLRPAREIHLSDQRIDARLQIVDDAQDGSASGLAVVLRSSDSNLYLLSVELGQTALYRGEAGAFTLLADAPAQREVGQWYTLSITAEDGTISASVDGVEALAFTDEQPLLAGKLALIANAASTVWLDTVAVYELAPAEIVPETALPYTLDESLRPKFNSAIFELLEAHLQGPEAEQALDDWYVFYRDDEDRLLVRLWTAEDEAEALVPFIEQVGGEVSFAEENRAEAYVPLAGLLELAALDLVTAITQPVLAESTSANAAPPAQSDDSYTFASPAPANSPGMGTIIPHSLDLLGVNAWHNAVNEVDVLTPFTGQGVDIAVIDTGFDTTGSSTAERACLGSSTVINGAGTSTHGIEVVEVLCDVAPGGRAWMYRAENIGDLPSRINQAIAGGAAAGFPAADVILITLNPQEGSTALNTALQAAHDNHIPVIASAGNMGGDTSVEFIYSGSGTTRVSILFATPETNDVVIAVNAEGKNPTRLTNNAGWSMANGPVDGTLNYVFPAGVCGEDFCNLTLEITPGSGESETFTVSANYTDARVTPDSTVTYPAPDPTNHNRLTAVARNSQVIAVGAVCGWQGQRYPLLSDSSPGALGQPNNASIKPEVVAPSRVRTSIHSDPFAGENCDGSNSFGGTSAAAAHVGGMAALLMANPNMVNIYGQPPGTPEALQAYLMSRAVDVNGGGYDNAYGAGVVQLGDPYFNLADQQIIRRPADQVAQAVYVASAYHPLGSEVPDGTPTRPYTSLPQAIQQAQDSGINTVVTMPGEYVSAFTLPADMQLLSYDAADQADRLPSHIWVNDTLTSGEGIGINGANVVVRGFHMTGSRPAYLTTSASLGVGRTTPFTLTVSANNAVIESNIFRNFDQPVRISNVPVARFAGNRFEGFYADTAQVLNQAGVIYIADSGGTDTILLEYNRFLNNTMQLDSFTANSSWMEPVVGIRRSRVDLHHNYFDNNLAESVIAIDQWLEGSEPSSTLYSGGDYDTNVAANKAGRFLDLPVVIYGSLFEGQDATDTRYSLVHMYQIPRLRFVNNTVANFRLNSQAQNPNNLFTVGHDGTDLSHVSDHRWDIHNNIFFNINTNGTLIRMAAGDMNRPGTDYGCLPIGSAPVFEGTIPTGARNNWFAPALQVSAGRVGGECDDGVGSVGAPLNGNTFTQTWNGQILVALSDTDEPTSAAARQSFMEHHFLNTFDSSHPYRLRPADPHLALDSGDLSAWQAIFGINYDQNIHRDLFRGPRIVDRTTTEGEDLLIDRGAYEMGDPDPVRFIDGDGSLAATIQEGGTVFIQMDSRLELGYRPYTIEFRDMPTIYDDDPNNACRGEPYRYNPVTYQLTYCPPPYLYTTGELVDALSFEYRALGTLNTGVTDWAPVQMTVTAVNDGVPASSDTAERTTVIYGRSSAVLLQPYAVYDANTFFLSDTN
ncbi:MAG: S8 family serine peptidase, partial [Phototrophicaceae bacterium]